MLSTAFLHRPYHGWIRGLATPGVPISFTGPATDHITQVVHQRGDFYEEDLLSMIGCMLGPAPGGTAVDIGANLGNHTLFFGAVLKMPVIAIEPFDRVRRILERNLADNGLEDRTTVIPMAASDCEATCRIHLPHPTNLGMAETRPAGDHPNDPVVAAAPLDTLLATCANAPTITLIKIDVEGAALAALRGARQTLDRDRPLLAVELGDEASRDEALDLLAPLGYRMFGPYCGTPTYVFTTRGTHPVKRWGYRHWRSYRRGRIRRCLERITPAPSPHGDPSPPGRP